MPDLSASTCSGGTGPSISGGSCTSCNDKSSISGISLRNFDTNSITTSSLSVDSLTFQGDTIFTDPLTTTLTAIDNTFEPDGTTGLKTSSGYHVNVKGTINVSTDALDSYDGSYYTNNLTTTTITVPGSTTNSMFGDTIQFDPSSTRMRIGGSGSFSPTYTLSVPDGPTYTSGVITNSGTNATFNISKNGGTESIDAVQLLCGNFTGTGQLCGSMRLGVNTTTFNQGLYGFRWRSDTSSSNSLQMYLSSSSTIDLYNNKLNIPGALEFSDKTSVSNCNYTQSTFPGIMHLQYGTGTTSAALSLQSMNFNSITGFLFNSIGSLDSGTSGTTTMVNSYLNISFDTTTGLFTYTGTSTVWVHIHTNPIVSKNSSDGFTGCCIKHKASASSTWDSYYAKQTTNAFSYYSSGMGFTLQTVLKLAPNDVFAVGIQTNGVTLTAIDSDTQRSYVTIRSL